MGEEQKKPEEKKEEEAKKLEEKKEEEVPPKAAAAGDDEKPKEEGKKVEEEAKDPPPLTPQEIILRVYMHCEGCARKVRKCLKGFDGVEEVETDCKAQKVVVKGEKADPLKVLERVQKKSHRQVELLSPIPKPASDEPKKPEEKEVAKLEEKKEEPPVITVVLNVHMHCEACAQEIRRRIQRMKGVESAEPDLKSSLVIVKGSFEAPNLVDFIYKRTGKHAVIVKVEPEKKEEEKPKEEAAQEEKKAEEAGGGAEKDDKRSEEVGKEKAGDTAADGGGSGEQAAAKPAEGVEQVEDPKLEMKKNEFSYNYPQNNHHMMMMMMYPPRFVQQEPYAYPPQIFSDENPNACSVM